MALDGMGWRGWHRMVLHRMAPNGIGWHDITSNRMASVPWDGMVLHWMASNGTNGMVIIG